MRLRFHILQLVGTVLFLSGCNKAANLARDNSADLRQATVDGPTTEAKSDRPTEAGEGLPGYLIDPAKVVIEAKDGTYTVTGSIGAVRNAKGENQIATVTLVKIPKASPKVTKQNKDWQMEGTALMSSKSNADGSFHLLGAIGGDDLLFIKVGDAESHVITYSAQQPNGQNLWIDGTSAKAIDQAASDQIAGQVATSTARALLVEQVKTTGKCRNCNLSGADLSNLDIPNCDLSLSNLMGARIRNTNLGDCIMTNSNLSQVDFTQSNLANANLTQTDITGAIFVGANVNGVIGQTIPPQ